MKFEERMKSYEDKRRLVTGMPIIARLDGVNFSSWTKGLEKPFDSTLSDIMIDTTTYLIQQTNALAGYTQSDEITLIWNPEWDTQPIYGGKVQKTASILAAMCATEFNNNKSMLPSWHYINAALFDCRVFQVPTLEEVKDILRWRMSDAQKNSVSMAANAVFSHKQLQGKKTQDKVAMLEEFGIDWEAYSQHSKYGTFFKRITIARKFTAQEIQELPPKHEAITNPDLLVERSEIVRVNDFLGSVKLL